MSQEKKSILKKFSDFFKMEDGTKGYFKAVGLKLTENFLSVKVWFFLLPFIVSTCYLGYMLYDAITISHTVLSNSLNPDEMNFVVSMWNIIKDTFIGWCTFNVSSAGTVIVVRETFKVSKINVLGQNGEVDKINRMGL